LEKDKRMKNSRSKTQTIAIAIFLILTIAATLVVLPVANAHTPAWQIQTWCYIGVSPDVVGVNQPVIIAFWINMVPPTANGAYGDRWSFTANVVKPDGTNDTLGPFTSDPVGGSYTIYTPTELGNYTIQAIFPGKIVNNQPNGVSPQMPTQGAAYINDTYLSSVSEPVTLVVQQEPIPSYQETPLPSGYWTRPIYGANHLWGSIAGQWLGGGDRSSLGLNSGINLYSTGPSTSHIVWAVPFWSGGTMGGGATVNFGSTQYYSGQQYENYGGPSIILDGKIYYTVNEPPREGWYCISLYTGETLYFRNTTGVSSGNSGFGGSSGSIPYGAPAFGQLYDYESPNQHGGFPYLWITNTGVTGRWDMLDGHTGNYICSIANVTQSTRRTDGTTVTTGATGTSRNDNTGSICYYNLVNFGNTTNPQMYLQIWNTSQTVYWYNNASGSNVYWEWRPYLNFTFDGNHGFSLNASIPAVQGSIRQVVTDQYIIGGTTGNITTNVGQNTQGNLWALNLDPTKGPLGSLLWNFTFTPPAGLGDTAYGGGGFGHDTAFGGLSAADGIFYYTNSMLRQYYVYSLNQTITGKPQGTLLWTSDPVSQWGFYGLGTTIYNGRLYNTNGYTGILIAFNATTGHIDWTWSAPSVGLGETPYTHTPLYVGSIADGKMYLFSSEHSVNSPIRRDAKIYCVDLTNGTMLWSMTCWPSNDPISSSPIIADGRLVVADIQDTEIYCFAPGLSKTTVSAPQTAPALGEFVTITGTVTDDTPTGRHNVNGELDFALKGTPAISDADMDAWMEYMFHQRPIPTNAKGVEVTLDAIDPNNNYVHIGTVTSDITGAYGFVWKPEVPGTYQIIATFAGSGAYSGSFAQTYMGVGEAPTTPAAPEYPQPIDNTMTILGVGIAMIIAVAIVGLMLLRKRP
jgi:hypothetical protein